jgi:hypothetical protein
VVADARRAHPRRHLRGARVRLPDGALTRARRAAIADGWQRVALAEHASIASFARLTLELLAHGAPADLILDATAAQADEVRHARAAFAIAARFAGHAIAPDRLPLDGGLDRSGDLAAVVRAAVLEGCVAETIAAEQVRRAAARASDPTLRHTLAAIADDEARHAELSWRLVRWALTQAPELRAQVAAAFDEGVTAVRRAGVRAPSGPRLDAWGLASRDADDQAAIETLDTIIVPCARALCAVLPAAEARR